jgi:hypothetical protein
MMPRRFIWLLDDPVARMWFAYNASEFADAQCTWERIAEKLSEEVYKVCRP